MEENTTGLEQETETTVDSFMDGFDGAETLESPADQPEEQESEHEETPADEELKVLMITHKVLATQQGYEKLLDILNDGLRDKEDPFLLFFMETVEPIYHAQR